MNPPARIVHHVRFLIVKHKDLETRSLGSELWHYKDLFQTSHSQSQLSPQGLTNFSLVPIAEVQSSLDSNPSDQEMR
jgi:hypothetical protein